ncbi:hypothetical protein XENTR_v10000774 [Xenopus tropicalis]|nr:hypothetical protein XENTR_v10000774 [Xenopus tropicalis]
MGDFAAPAASNGSSLCISTALGSGNAPSIGGVGSHSSNNPPPSTIGPNAANNGSSVSIPKHSTVVERLRQRIEGCRRHHVSCESRYQQAQAEQLDMERRDTVNLYQRSLEQRAKKSSSSQGGASAGAAAGSASGGAGGNKHHHQQHQQQQQVKQQQQQQDAETAGSSGTAEQRNHTLIMMHLKMLNCRFDKTMLSVAKSLAAVEKKAGGRELGRSQGMLLMPGVKETSSPFPRAHYSTVLT